MTENKPINDIQYNRIPLDKDEQVVFTGRISGAGQIWIPPYIRNGTYFKDEKTAPVGTKLELRIVAIHEPQE